VQRLELSTEEPTAEEGPAPTHTPHTGEFEAVK
jgi:hypothetical protein